MDEAIKILSDDILKIKDIETQLKLFKEYYYLREELYTLITKIKQAHNCEVVYKHLSGFIIKEDTIISRPDEYLTLDAQHRAMLDDFVLTYSKNMKLNKEAKHRDVCFGNYKIKTIALLHT